MKHYNLYEQDLTCVNNSEPSAVDKALAVFYIIFIGLLYL